MPVEDARELRTRIITALPSIGDPLDPEPAFHVGELNFVFGTMDATELEALATEQIIRSLQSAGWYYWRARARKRQGRYDTALDDASIAIKNCPIPPSPSLIQLRIDLVGPPQEHVVAPSAMAGTATQAQSLTWGLPVMIIIAAAIWSVAGTSIAVQAPSLGEPLILMGVVSAGLAAAAGLALATIYIVLRPTAGAAKR
jgi:hypothetical protein